MKKLVLLALLSCCLAPAFSKKIKIKVANFQFTPATVNAKVGDTIVWVWVNGTHTVTSTKVPTGAKPFNDSPMTSAHPKFQYILKAAGTYSYKCTFHASLGMKGTLN